MLLPMCQSAFALIIPHNKQVQNLSGLITSMYFFLMSHLWLVVAHLGLAPDWSSDLCVLHPSLLPEPRLREYHSPERSSCTWQVHKRGSGNTLCLQKSLCTGVLALPNIFHWSKQVTWPNPKSAGLGTVHMASTRREQNFFKWNNLHTLKTKLWSFAADKQRNNWKLGLI